MSTPDRSLLCCPVCRGTESLGWTQTDAHCDRCGHQSPGLGPVPCLLSEPAFWRSRWSTDLAAFSSMMAAAADVVRRDLSRFDLRLSTRTRLEGFLGANERNAAQILELFRTAGITPSQDAEVVGQRRAEAAGRLPLTHHYELLLRDWGWGDDFVENRLAADLVMGLAEERTTGRTLVLGAGAGRLTYDVHQALVPSVTIALDMDPLLGLVAQRVLSGEGQELVEFPFAPDGEAWADRTLSRPNDAPSSDLHWILGDALDPPVVRGVWDTVLTTWFVDVCDADFRDLVGVVHRLLAPGGRWINVGPLLYPTSRPPAQRYPPNEVLELVGLGGFELERSALDEVRYLRSALSGHARLESVLSFVGRKTSWPDPAETSAEDWAVMRHRPVPTMPDVSTEHALLERVRALVDGQRCIDDIAKFLSSDGLPKDVDPRDATTALLLELHRRTHAQGRS